MKKYIFLFVVILILGLGSSVNAESFFAEISGDKVLMRKTNEDGIVELKAVDVYNLENYKYFGIRSMAENCGADVSWDDSTKTVNVIYNDLVISLKNNNSKIYINGNEFDFGYPVIIIEGKSYAPLELYKAFTGELNIGGSVENRSDENIEEAAGGISVEHGENSDRIRIYGAADGLKHDFMLSNPSRIVLDIENIKVDGIIEAGQTYEKIRYFRGPDGITRIVFDLVDSFAYNLNYEGDDIVITISEDGSFSLMQELVDYRNNSVIINTGNYKGYIISRSTDPFTIKALIPARLTESSFEIDVSGELISSILIIPSDSSTEIVVKLEKQCAFELEKLKNTFIIGIYQPVVKGVVYHNIYENPHISLDVLSKFDNILEIKNYGNEIIVKISDPDGALTEGQIYINDDVVKSIFVTRNGSEAILRITTKKNKVVSKAVIDEKPCLIIGDNDYNDFLVVISPGHGGSDPGAIVNSVYEAHLNLEIAFKLRKELESAGVTVHMLRTDDTFVSLDDRTKISNNLKADLFLSIHCNTLDNSDFEGLMTLVHSGRIDYKNVNGKTAGTIIHEEVIEATGATDRGVRDRDKIIVLKDTAMPAVEIECGFLTNAREFDKLLDDSYQWSIAAGTAEGILKVLDLLD